MVGVGTALLSVRGQVFDGAPADPLRTCTVNEPDAKIAFPFSWFEVLFKLETTQAEAVAQPGPRKKTSALEVLKLVPSIVKLNDCPPTSEIGEVEILVMVGAAWLRVKAKPFDNWPSVFLTFTV